MMLKVSVTDDEDLQMATGEVILAGQTRTLTLRRARDPRVLDAILDDRAEVLEVSEPTDWFEDALEERRGARSEEDEGGYDSANPVDSLPWQTAVKQIENGEHDDALDTIEQKSDRDSVLNAVQRRREALEEG